jgi:hypothetical protein
VSRPKLQVVNPRRNADIRRVSARYAIGGVLAAALLALPASAAAGQGGQVATLAGQQCAQERADVGRRVFRKRYGQKHTMRACARRHRARVSAAVGSASQDCQADLADFGETDFIDLYGDEPTDSLDYAMAECVAEGVDEILNSDDDVEDDTDEE